jgi:hypothetical protein
MALRMKTADFLAFRGVTNYSAQYARNTTFRRRSPPNVGERRQRSIAFNASGQLPRRVELSGISG